MPTSITATEAGLRFLDLLDRVRDRGESFVILHDGEEVGQLTPPPAAHGSSKRPTASLRSLLTLVQEHSDVDDSFADDLERVQWEQPVLKGDPWDC